MVWKKEEIQNYFCDAWKCVFREECLGLDGDFFFGVRDTNEELKDAEEEDSNFTGGNVDGAAGSADGLNNDVSAAINTEEKLIRELHLAAKQLDMSRFTDLNQRYKEVR